MIVGHKKQVDFLNKAIFLKNIPHALMFEGISGLGKKHLATYLFKKINCINGGKEPCNKCKNCFLINQRSHPDFNVVEPQGKEIKINQIKELAHKISFHCYESSFKWIIINDAHLMNKEASNSLLKILEEPKNNTVIILITNHSESIPDTVKSRAQRIKFFPLKENEIVSLLESLKCDQRRIQEITSFSFGIPGRAIEFFNNCDKIKERKNKIKKLSEIVSSQTPFYLKFQYAKKISSDSENLKEILETWLSYLRNLLLENAKKNKIDKSFYKTKNFLKEIEKAIYSISKVNANNRLIIENLILNL